MAIADHFSRVRHCEQVTTLCMTASALARVESGSAYRLFLILEQKEIQDAQKSCPAAGMYLRACEHRRKWKDPENLKAKALWQACNELIALNDGFLRYRNFKGRSSADNPLGGTQNPVVVLPRNVRRRFLWDRKKRYDSQG